MPITLSNKIRKAHQESEEGWGRLKANAIINKTKWDTAIWFDSKMKCYLLPLKAQIRKKEGLTDGSEVKASLAISLF